jgi:hypothetical protein
MTTKTFNVVTDNLPELRAAIVRLNKRAKRLGLSPIVLTEGETRAVKDEDSNREVVRTAITVTGETPKLNGWTFAATLQHEDGGVILRTVPGVLPEGALASYRDAESACDHCRVNRRRNDTYIVRHDNGDIKQVGSSCLADFLGHDNPHALASLAELVAVAMETAGAMESEGMGGGGEGSFGLRSFIAFTIACVEKHGWLSRSKAREQGRQDSTATLVTMEMTRKGRGRPLFDEPTDEMWARADKYVETVSEDFAAKETLSDYEHNLQVILLGGYVTPRMTGLAASVVSCAQRILQERADRAAGTASEFVGQPKDRVTLVLTVTKATTIGGNYGPSTFVNFRDAAGNRLVWKASGARPDFVTVEGHNGGAIVEGATYEVYGTIKGHEVSKKFGHKETWLARCTIMAPGRSAQMEVEKAAAKEAKKVAAREARKTKKATEVKGEEPAPAVA